MRSRFFAAFTSFAALALTAAPRSAHADTSYFVLDFNDGTSTPDYSFQLNYSGFTPTAADMIDLLVANVTNPGFSENYTQYSFGRFYNAFTYGSKTAASTGDFSKYWGFWVSSDGITWTSPDTYGASDDILTNGGYAAFSYGANGGTAPVTPTNLSAVVSAAAAPEPEALAFALFGGIGMFVAMHRQRRR